MYTVELVVYDREKSVSKENSGQVSIVGMSNYSYEDALKKAHQEGVKKYGITSDDIYKIGKFKE